MGTRSARSWALGLAVGALFAPCAARADAVPDMPPPRCDPGFVVAMTHGGPECARPTCRDDAECPSGLRCTPRRCIERTRDERCDEAERSSEAKGPPDPCESYLEGGACDEAHPCPGPAYCPLGRCVPPEELPPAEGAGSSAAPSSSGGGCCGSRGTRASGAMPWGAALSVALLGVLAARKREE